MEEKSNNKTYLLITLGVIGTVLLTLGITYAYWRLTKEQTNENVVITACLDVDIESQQDDINLPKAYPISDTEAESLVPFKFTIHNKCEDNASFQINLESMSKNGELEIPEAQRLNPKYLKFKLNEVEQNGITRLLTGSKEEDTTRETSTITNAYDAHKLIDGYIEPNGSKSYELRIWMDSETTAEETESMNKTFVSKISVTSTYIEEEKIQPKVQFPGKAIPLAEEGEDGLYAVEHNDLSELGSEWSKAEYRYAGVNPDNYVLFNNEKWRIIGLVNVKTTSGVEQRIKIIRTDGVESQKNFGLYAWDKKSSPTNNWTSSFLKNMLNGIYFNSEGGTCYTGSNRSEAYQSTCDFSGSGYLPKGLDEEAREMLDSEGTWNIGGWDSSSITADTMYEEERGTSTGGGMDFENVYPAEWYYSNHKGIGLMYPSDYGYAVGGSVRMTCLAGSLYDYGTKNNCYANDWLKASSGDQWLLSPYTSYTDYAYKINSSGSVDTYGETNFAFVVWPTGYLSSSVTIYDGDGSINNPFRLSIN